MCGETNSRWREQLAKDAKGSKGLSVIQRILWLGDDVKWEVVTDGSKYEWGKIV